MSKSVIYAVNSASQTVAINGIVNFGSEVRKYGCNVGLSGGNVIVSGIGYYSIDTNITITPNTAGTITLTVYKDGVAIPGATATLTAVATTDYVVSIPAIIRQTCCCDSTITVELTGVESVIINAAIVVEKL